MLDVATADDAALAVGAAAGDPESLAAIYDRYADALLSFCRQLVPGPDDAQRCLREVFVVAATELDSCGPRRCCEPGCSP